MIKLDWDHAYFKGGNGVLTGCDEKHEWMLKWWWNHYSQSNHHPVTFLDFGMSKSAKIWCEKRGGVIPVTMKESALCRREDLSINIQKQWETIYAPSVWNSRKAWSLKPLGLLKTPYTFSAWIDIDCMVLKSIKPLFNALERDTEMAIAIETRPDNTDTVASRAREKGIPYYNTRVFSFKTASPLILKWAQNMLERNNEFMGDQEALNTIFFDKKYEVKELAPIFNHSFMIGKTPETAILHYSCTRGKHEIFRSL